MSSERRRARHRGLLLLLTLTVLLGSAGAAAGGASISPRVESFSPRGTARDVRQVKVRFSTQMVAFGDPRLPDPFDIQCDEPGHGRWADARNWIYDFERDLPAGVRCTFALRAGLKSLSGEALEGETRFSFDTGGPAIRGSLPHEGDASIDEHQVFLLALDAEANPDSVRAHAFCEVQGLAERIPVEILEGDAREKVLASRRLLGYRYFRLFDRERDGASSRTPEEAFREAERRVLAVRCRRTLPPGMEVRLVWGAGIASPSGIATTAAQGLAFRVRPAFTVRFECRRVNPNAGCIPTLPMRVVFSAPVESKLAGAVRIRTEKGEEFAPQPIEGGQPVVEAVQFSGPFPENTPLTVHLPEGLVDDAGRRPENAERFPLDIGTDEAPPLAKFPGEFGVLELEEGGVLPVTLRNVEAELAARKAGTGVPGRYVSITDSDRDILDWLHRVERAMAYRGRWEESPDGERRWKNLTGLEPVLDAAAPAVDFTVPRPAGARPMEVVGIPLGGPGFYVVELASPRLGQALLGEARPRYVATAALVTNLALHFKSGPDGSLAWVTTLDGAEPVAGAELRVNEYCRQDGRWRELWRGVTGADGIARIGGDALPDHSMCSTYSPPQLMVSARKDGDMAFALSGWGEGVQPWDFNLPMGSVHQRRIAHTVFDRTLFRAGETVSMKHFVREHMASGLHVPARLPRQLRITHEGSGQEYLLPVAFDERGVAESSWTIPAAAKLGIYQVTLDDPGGSLAPPAGSFRVDEYRVPTMQGLIQPPAAAVVNAREITVDLYLSYLSGGGASHAPVRVRALVEPRRVQFRGYEDYVFGGEDVTVGLDEGPGEDYDPYWYFRSRASQPASGPAQVIPVTLDGNGSARVTIPGLPAGPAAQQVTVEMEYQDANGERLSVSKRIPLWPSAVNLGIRTEGWVASRDNLRVRVVALDTDGKPVAGQKVTVDLFRTQVYSYRKRLIGGFYAYEHARRTEPLEADCTGVTDAQGLLFCELAPEASGNITIRARAEDAQGNPALATRNTWVVGDGDWWFEVSDTDRMDVIPEKNEYEPGETARFQVRMPFRTARALVTVEREGVIDSFVTDLSGREPVVEVPIKPSYSPNVYVSVLALRGRVGWLQSWIATIARRLGLPWKIDGGVPTGTVDLGKPAWRLGIGQINVGWKPHRLEVDVNPARKVFKVRDRAEVEIRVQRADGGDLPEDTEVAIAVVDEGLLELMPNESWALLEKMMQKRGIEVTTFTSQIQVVGKRHYGRKAVPHGGGGGRRTVRELFDTLLFWQGRVPVDRNGRARIGFPLNDSLTSFRIVAVASGGNAHFGTGQAAIRTTQDLMLHSGLPELVRETDTFAGVFTVRNAGGRPVEAEVAAKVSGETLPPQSVTLAPGEAREIQWPMTAPAGAAGLLWEVTVTSKDGTAADHLKVKQRIVPAYPVRTFQATLAQLDGPLTMDASRPADALPGRGGIRVTLRPKLGDGLAGVREFMANYPYVCFEQRVSRAVTLGDDGLWASLMRSLPAYLDKQGLVKFFASDWLQGSDVLTAYVLSIAHEAGREIPHAERERMLEGLRGFVEGRLVRGSPLKTADLSIRRLAAVEALSRYQRVPATLLDSITIEPQLWPTSALLDFINVLKRVPDIRDRDARLREAQGILRARLDFHGTTLNFSSEDADNLWWLMANADRNAVRAVLSLLDEPAWREDIPRLVRGALGRQLRGHWSTTPANAWGVLAMEKFSAAFEGEAVSGATTAAFGGATGTVRWADALPAEPLDFSWPETSARLSVSHAGTGRPWVMIQGRAAIPLKEPLFQGYRIRRTVTPVVQQRPGEWRRGDVARVTLEIEAQSDMTWVVVEDPVPAGATILGGGLGRDSAILAGGEARAGHAWPAFEERRLDSFRAYYEYVPKGTWVVEYTVRYNNAGEFLLPATHVEAMYAPEMSGELPNGPVRILDGT